MTSVEQLSQFRHLGSYDIIGIREVIVKNKIQSRIEYYKFIVN